MTDRPLGGDRSSRAISIRGTRAAAVRFLAIAAVSAVVAGACGDDGTSGSDALRDVDRPTPPVVDVDDEPTASPTPAPTEQSESDTPATPAPSPSPSPTPLPTPTSEPRLVEIPSDLRVDLRLVLRFDRPIALRPLPRSDHHLLAGQNGRIAVVDLSGDEAVVVGDVIDIADRLSRENEQGLLGIAVSPDGNHLYADYTDRAGTTTIVEWPLSDDGSIDAGSERTVLTVEQPASNHNAGDIVFGPDGFLYVTLGDGGGGGDPWRTGQDPSTLLGSILRIAPRDGEPYAVPSDNPFAERGGRSEIWLYGVRNPWRISFDADTGDLWVADVGQGQIEEVNVLYASDGLGRGANLGWSSVEGSAPFNAAGPPADDYVAPIHEYTHDEGCSVTGGYVYRGQELPELTGIYVFGDYCSGQVWGLASSQEQGVVGRFDIAAVGEGGIGSFAQDAAGELYVLDVGRSQVLRMERG